MGRSLTSFTSDSVRDAACSFFSQTRVISRTKKVSSSFTSIRVGVKAKALIACAKQKARRVYRGKSGNCHRSTLFLALLYLAVMAYRNTGPVLWHNRLGIDWRCHSAQSALMHEHYTPLRAPAGKKKFRRLCIFFTVFFSST